MYRTPLLRRLLPMVLILLTLLGGCSGEKDITFHDLTMTVDAGFEWLPINEEDVATYTTASASGVQITLSRTTFLTLAGMDFTAPALITVEEYRDMIIESNGYDASLCEVNGILAFVYEFEGGNQYGTEPYKSLCCVYKSDSAFWCVDFYVPLFQYEQWEAQFFEWATTVRFAESDPGVYVYD